MSSGGENYPEGRGSLADERYRAVGQIKRPEMCASWVAHPTLRLVRGDETAPHDMPLARGGTPNLAYRAPPRRDAAAFSRDLALRSSTGRALPFHMSSASTGVPNMSGAGAHVRRAPGISWDLACVEHERRGALGGESAFGVVDDGVYPSAPAGSAHIHLGTYAANFGGPPAVTHHYHCQTVGYSEEERRLFLITGERARKHAEQRSSRTNTIPGMWTTRDDEERAAAQHAQAEQQWPSGRDDARPDRERTARTARAAKRVEWEPLDKVSFARSRRGGHSPDTWNDTPQSSPAVRAACSWTV